MSMSVWVRWKITESENHILNLILNVRLHLRINGLYWAAKNGLRWISSTVQTCTPESVYCRTVRFSWAVNQQAYIWPLIHRFMHLKTRPSRWSWEALRKAYDNVRRQYLWWIYRFRCQGSCCGSKYPMYGATDSMFIYSSVQGKPVKIQKKIRKAISIFVHNHFKRWLFDITQEGHSSQDPVFWRVTGSQVNSCNVVQVCSNRLFIYWTWVQARIFDTLGKIQLYSN